MIKNMAINFTDYLIKKDIVPQEKRQWCIYAFEKRISSGVSLPIIIGVGTVLFGFIETLLFVISLYPAQYLAGHYYIQYSILTAAILAIYKLAPINHPNLRLNAQQMAMNRKLSLRITLTITIFAIIITHAFPNKAWGMCTSMGVACAAVMVVIAKILKQEVHSNEKLKGNNHSCVNKSC
ncbi:MAG: accessory gene regulator B family protein [Oscillospiraceae bacterium]